MSEKRDRGTFWSRVSAAGAFAAALAAGLAAFLSDAGNIREKLFGTYQPAELSLRDADQRVLDEESWEPPGIADLDAEGVVIRWGTEVVIEKQGPGSAKDCRGQLVFNRDRILDGVLGKPPSETTETFDIPENVLQREVYFSFQIPSGEWRESEKGLRVVCAGIVTNVIRLPSWREPRFEALGEAEKSP